VWAVGIGLGAYLAGPPVIEVIGDIGTASAIGLGVLVLVGVGFELARRRHRRAQV
jgi:hypothetical protein